MAEKMTMEDIRNRVESVIGKLRENHMQGYFVEKKEDVPAMVASLLTEGETVAVGGSETLKQCGVMELLRSGDYKFLDRYREGLNEEELHRIFVESFGADTYLCSCNAVTEKGVLYNVDGNSNRVAAILYGPRSVIMVVGYQKIVKNLDDAVSRVRTVAAPLNCRRLGCNTYCSETGKCIELGNEISSGCRTDSRICSNFVISSKQRQKNRIKVIFVGEEVGY